MARAVSESSTPSATCVAVISRPAVSITGEQPPAGQRHRRAPATSELVPTGSPQSLPHEAITFA